MSNFTIISTTPSANQYNISCSPTILVEFSVDVAEDSVVQERILVTRLSDKTILNIDNISVVNSVVSFTIVPDQDPTPMEELLQDSPYQVTILAGIESVLGDTTALNYSWVFYTGTSTQLTKPSISTPSTNSYVETLSFSWNTITDTVSYTLEISTDRIFSNPTVYTIYAPETTFVPEEDLAIGTYFARVRAEGVTVSSWSDIIVFSYQVTVDTNSDPAIPGDLWISIINSFRLLSVSPEHSSANKDISKVVFTFSNTLPAKEDIMWPVVESSPLYGITLGTISGTWDRETDTTISYSASFDDNTTYTITFDNLFADSNDRLLDEPIIYWFTTKLTPLYAYPRQLRTSKIGKLITNIPDDVLYYHLYRASMEVNRITLGTTASIADMSKSLASSAITPNIIKQTLLWAMIFIIEELLLDSAARGIEKKTLGDFSYQYSQDPANTLVQLKRELENELYINESMVASLKSSDSLQSVTSWGPQVQERGTF